MKKTTTTVTKSQLKPRVCLVELYNGSLGKGELLYMRVTLIHSYEYHNMDADIVKQTTPDPCLGNNESDSKLYTKFEFREGKKSQMFKNATSIIHDNICKDIHKLYEMHGNY